MKIFSGNSNLPLAHKIASELNLTLSPIEHHTFPDGERRIKLEVSVAGEDCILINPTSPPVESNLMELCFIADAMKGSGANSITAVVPYLGYQRQDHIFRTGEARSLEVVINMMEVSGITRFIGVDFHSIKIPELFTIDVTHLSALPLFAQKIKEITSDMDNSCIVSPDMGGIRRTGLLKEELGGEIEAVAVEKNRDVKSGEISASGIHGNVKNVCFIVDDMISSGKTIVQCVDELKKAGGKEFYVFATHAVFSKEAHNLLQNSDIKTVFITDSIEVKPEDQFSKLEVLSLAPLISSSIL
ncbi:MAG: ribose-phosphate pyrophosphokinase [Candidatus Levybacteria bacterium]|nr:ribose-phosphate pyrophosphokinase [Candidatus Levybacteria bacterium]